MSTLVATTLQDRVSSDSGPIRDAAKGSARAWINFNGTGTVAISASYNVSSVTDNGTGNYTINLTNALASTGYAVTGSHRQVATGTGNAYNPGISDLTTSSFRVSTTGDGSSAATLVDAALVSLVAFR